MHEPPEDDTPDEGTLDDKELNRLIDEWLSDDRPERYSPSEKEWMDGAVAKAVEALRHQFNRDEIIEDAARRRVYNREGQATQRANRVLRDIADTGRLPLGWGEGDNWKDLFADILTLPLSKSREDRVRFGVASPAELEQWELENAREQSKRDMAQIRAREGAVLLAEWERKQGVQRVEDLRVTAGPSPETGSPEPSDPEGGS